MNLRQALAIVCLTCLPTLIPTARAAEAPARADVGEVERVQRSAEAEFAERIRPLSPASSVLYQDLLRTGNDARLKVRLEDGSEITMGERAELRVDDFVYEPAGRQTLRLSSLKGALLFVGNHLRPAPTRSVEVHTPVAILGVRGTRLWVGPIDGATGVLVLEGEVLVRSAGGLLSLFAGEGTSIHADGTLEPRQPWPEEKIARARAMVSFDR